MTKVADRPIASLLTQAMEDVSPFPGRLATTWRVAVLTTLVATVAMMLQTPEAAVSCYLVAFVMKADSSGSIVLAIILTFLVTVVIALATFLAVLSIGSPGLRLLTMATVSFVMLFIGSASKLGETGSMVALVVADILSLIYTAPGGEIITSGLRFAWEMIALPMMMIITFSLVLGRSSVSLLRDSLLQRLRAAQNVLARPNADEDGALRDLLRRGNADALSKLKFVGLFHQVSKAGAAQIAVDVSASYQLLLAASALRSDDDEVDRFVLAAHLRDVINAIEKSQRPAPPPEPSTTPSAATMAIHRALRGLAGMEDTIYAPGTKSSFFSSDAFTNPEHTRFALKTTAAAMTCYILYAGIDWPGIHTAMITCYVASLRTSGETIHKLGLRILGCLVGACMGLLSIIFLIPHMHSIGHLILLVFAGTFIAAWISNGSERSSYAGIQVGLAFFLSILHGLGPSVDLELARDRTIGILVGNTVMYLVATRIWPIGTAYALRANLAKMLQGLAALSSLPGSYRGPAVALAAEVEQSAGAMARAFDLLPLEPAAVRPDKIFERNVRLIADDAERLNSEIYLSGTDLPGLHARLLKLADEVGDPQYCAGPPPSATAPGSSLSRDQATEIPLETRLQRMEDLVRGKPS